MRKYILSLLLLGSLALAKAQGIDIGIKAGFNTRQLDDHQGSNRSGFVGGVFMALKTSDKFAIQPELLFVQKGEKFDFGAVKLNALSLPVLFKYKVFSPISLEAGPIFNFKLTDHVNFGEKYADLKDKIKSKAFGLGAGIGVALDLPLGLCAGVRYTLRLLNSVQNQSDKNLDLFGKNGKFRSWEFTIGYSIL